MLRSVRCCEQSHSELSKNDNTFIIDLFYNMYYQRDTDIHLGFKYIKLLYIYGIDKESHLKI